MSRTFWRLCIRPTRTTDSWRSTSPRRPTNTDPEPKRPITIRNNTNSCREGGPERKLTPDCWRPGKTTRARKNDQQIGRKCIEIRYMYVVLQKTNLSVTFKMHFSFPKPHAHFFLFLHCIFADNCRCRRLDIEGFCKWGVRSHQSIKLY